jgi:hypothetical protein
MVETLMGFTFRHQIYKLVVGVARLRSDVVEPKVSSWKTMLKTQDLGTILEGAGMRGPHCLCQ